MDVEHGEAHYTNLSIQAFLRVGYRRTISHAWEDVAYLPIFNNALFTRADGQPWSRKNGAVCNIFHGAPQLKYLYQLLSPRDFIIEGYRNSSTVGWCRLATPQEIQRRYFQDWGVPRFKK